jgi:hypothetical protein
LGPARSSLSFHGAGSALAAHGTENFLAETQCFAGLSLRLDAQAASDGIHLASLHPAGAFE